MTQVSFWGGVGKIGGNKILISPEDKSHKSILLDFGKDFNIPYLDTFLNPRKFNIMEDYIALGIIPEPKPGTHFHGLYRKDLYYFKPEVRASARDREIGIKVSKDEKFLNIKIPGNNIEVIYTSFSGSPQFGYKAFLSFKISYEDEEEIVSITQKHFDKLIEFFKIDEDQLLNRLFEAGETGSEEMNDLLTSIIHAFGDNLVKIDCSFYNNKWYIFSISGEESKLSQEYKQEYKRNYKVWKDRFGYDPIGEPQISHVLITHSHSDHVSEIELLDPSVINVCSKISKECLDHFDFVQSATFTGIIRYTENFIFVPYKRDETKIRRGYANDLKKIMRKFITLNSSDEITLDYYVNKRKIGGAFKITFYETDHSTPGAGAYLIEDIGNNKRIVYTGDIRLHGPRNLRENTERFLKAARDFDTDILICEGTNVSSTLGTTGEIESEDALQKAVSEIIKESKSLVMFACSLRDISRFNSFLEASKENNRRLAILPNTYKLIERLNNAIRDKEKGIIGDYSNIPSLDENIVPYISRKGWGQYEIEDYNFYPATKSLLDEDSKVDFEKISKVKPIKIDEISRNLNKYVIYTPFWGLFDLIDLRPPPESVFIHSKSEPFEPEMELEQEKLMNWLALFKLKPENYFQVHCSGHGRMKDIEKIINQINPKVVYPIHSNEPELVEFLDLGDIKVITPEYGKYYQI